MYFPLRVHGHHSLLTGVDSPAALVARARELALPGLALADVDTLAGVVDFAMAARAASSTASFRAIFAAEISDPSGAPGRIVALAKNERGYKNLCKLVSARQLGCDPGVRGARLDGPESFRCIESAVRHQEDLIFLVDHPRLLIGLSGRVDAHALFAAISPAALRTKSAQKASARLPRNAHLEPARRVRPIAARPSGSQGAHEDFLESPKVPPPERPVAALDLVEAARAVGVATLAVPDVYCALASEVVDHRMRVAIKHNALVCDLDPSWTAAEPTHLLTGAEMCALYADLPECAGPFRIAHAPSKVPGAVARTLDVAAQCDFTPALGGVVFPTIELAPGETAYSALCALAFDGARTRYKPLRPEVVRRLDYELSTIDRLGFAPYFLLVQRIAEFARARGIPCVGRGSAADSLVAYCLRLSDADPLRYKLIFERFLNPARRDRPDIDLDFCWRRRDEVLEHVYELFGPERTAMISTLNRCGLRSAFREAALVEGLPPAEVNRWSRRLPYYVPLPGAEEVAQNAFDGTAASDHEAPTQRALGPVRKGSLGERGTEHDASDERELPAALRDNPIARAFRATPEAAGFPFEDERYVRVLHAAARLLDAPRHFGLHPGGVVVAPGPITDFVACQRAAKGVVVTQLDKDAIEAIGLVKMDLLGNRALTVIDDCTKALAARGIAIDLESIAEDDASTAETLRTGRTIGCFQVESPGMRNLLQQIGASTMNDVIQAVALIRPGPAGSGMKDAYVRRFRGLEAPDPPHPRLTDILWDTRGVMLYQEDVMQAAACIAGMDLAEADLLRRALQKRKTRELETLCERFLAGAAAQGIARDDALRVWDLVANFASFGFCKAHAVTYGRIAYRTVWLKTHHPAPFLAAFLASETGYYEPRVYVEEARRIGVAILPPDVNKSARSFTAESSSGGAVDALRIGLSQVKGISQRTLDAIFDARAQHGFFLTLPDFLERTRAHSDEALHLIQCGAFDAFDRTRPELVWRLHLLRAPERPRLSRVRASELGDLDLDELAACRATPHRRATDALSNARSRTGGWRANGIGVGNADLAPGESALLFPAREAPALALPRLPDVDATTRGRLEYELLGLSVHAHPVALFPCPADLRIANASEGEDANEARAFPRLRPVNPAPCGEIARFEGGRITLRGWPAATRHVRTKDGRTMRFLTLEDESGLAEVVLFADVYERDGKRLAEFGTLCVTGIVENQMGACTLHAECIW